MSNPKQSTPTIWSGPNIPEESPDEPLTSAEVDEICDNVAQEMSSRNLEKRLQPYTGGHSYIGNIPDRIGNIRLP